MPFRYAWIVFLTMGLSVMLYADHVRWSGHYDAALRRAMTEHKPLLVLLVKPGQSLSRDIVRRQFMDQPYVDTINQHFVSVMLTYGSKRSYPIEMYYTTAFPTLFLVDSQTELFLHAPLYGREIEGVGKVVSAIIPQK